MPAVLPETVLLVDDEKAILDVLQLGFKKAGIETRRALTAEDAILQLEGEKFAAVVSDKNLPGKSGLDVLKYVADKQPHCARLIITGYVSTESVLEAMKLGADDYLLKPFESIMLVVERVKHAIAHRRTQAERQALADSLREMEKSLRKSESTAFQKVTELDLLQNVMELKIDDATSELRAKVDKLEGELASEKDRRAALRKTLLELAEGQVDEKLKKRLQAEAEILG
ncbi:MAG: response regulator [Myxococcaceae bacterium]